MKLSDALREGAKILKPRRGYVSLGRDRQGRYCGCAITMALAGYIGVEGIEKIQRESVVPVCDMYEKFNEKWGTKFREDLIHLFDGKRYSANRIAKWIDKKYGGVE